MFLTIFSVASFHIYSPTETDIKKCADGFNMESERFQSN